MKAVNLDVPASSLGEGPLWDLEQQCLWWVDIDAGKVHQYDMVHKVHKEIHAGQLCSAVVLCRSGRLMVTVKDGFAYLDVVSGTVDGFVPVEELLSDNRFNDGKCDPAGRFWAGTMDYRKGLPQAGSLYVLEKDRSVTKKLANITCSNGMAWSPDQNIFYYIDSPTYKVMAFDYDKATGAIGGGRTVVSIPESQGMPDGMTIDTEGMLWIALWGGAAVARYHPFSGACLSMIPLPVSNVTSCTFGGTDLTDLYITTAKAGPGKTDAAQQPLAGQVFVCKNSGARGIAPFKFMD
ncbi:SMP-30/gluconolactonase/LRE family protein [Niabella sp.]|uniref:SMP-30/gluconolactonase/LRE family protein n=1 Tax=Niabella sp. TaxID=1962976 RepID=UPI002609B71D|nr:SMP-30/gluconolactonase/LRE family protein [Niabella sp.]